MDNALLIYLFSAFNGPIVVCVSVAVCVCLESILREGSFAQRFLLNHDDTRISCPMCKILTY
jgi:hypothetical protein